MKLKYNQVFREEDKDGGGGGGSEPNWRDSLPEELRADPSLQNFESPEQLAKSFIETKRMQGNSVRVPGQDAGEEDWKKFNESLMEKVPTLMLKPDFNDDDQSIEFYRQMGMPEKPDDYVIPEIENFDATTLDEETTAYLRGLAHEGKLNKKQFEKVVVGMIKRQNEQNLAMAKSINEGQQALRGEWGNAYKDNVALAKQAAIDTGAPQELLNAIENNGVKADTLKWLHSIATQLGGEGKEVGGQGKGGEAALTPAEARAQIDEMLNNSEHPYWIAAHPGHEDAIKRMVQLQRHANP